MKNHSIKFFSIPESLKFELPFDFDPSIPLPVETEEKLPLEELNREMILSGMLKIIANPKIVDIPYEWVIYYRNFILTVKPEIYHEFTTAAIVKAKNGEFDMALEITTILEGLFPSSPGVLLNKALILEDKATNGGKNTQINENENKEALKAYEAALSIEPVLPDTLFNAGFFFMRLRDFPRARDCFNKYIEVGEESEKRKQAKKIIQDLNTQGLDDCNFNEAYECIIRGDDELGLLKIRNFIEKFPKVSKGWFILGWVLRKLGRYKDSLESLKKAEELGGSNSEIQNEMAICLMELGDIKGAKKELELALSKDQENTKIISNLGVLALKFNEKDKAAAFFRTVIELDPNDPLAKYYLNELN